jgi:hypothetical protein
MKKLGFVLILLWISQYQAMRFKERILIKSSDWIKDKITLANIDGHENEKSPLLKCTSKYCKRRKNGFSKLRMKNAGKSLREQLKGKRTLKGIVRSFKKWFKRFGSNLSRKNKKRILRMFKKYLKKLKKRQKRVRLIIGSMRKNKKIKWNKRRLNRQFGSWNRNIPWNLVLNKRGSKRKRFKRKLRRWIRKQRRRRKRELRKRKHKWRRHLRNWMRQRRFNNLGTPLYYSYRRRAKRIKWLKKLRKLRKKCFGNRKCLVFLKNNRPKSKRSLRKVKRYLRKFRRRRRRYKNRIGKRWRKFYKKQAFIGLSKRKRKLFRRMWNMRKKREENFSKIKKFHSEKGSSFYIPDFPDVIKKVKNKETKKSNDEPKKKEKKQSKKKSNEKSSQSK